ncbi:MarR family winged helix-turn-helix transcriptional regulator [Vibrio sp. RC27]
MKDYTDNCPAFLTNIVGNYLHQDLTNKLAESSYNLSKQQLRILFYLYEEDGLSQKQLMELIKLSKISLVKIINDLEEANVVVRVQSESDMRVNRIFLTPLGKKLKSPLLGLIDQHKADIFEGFTEEEIGLYVSLLQKVIVNITKRAK